MAKLTKSYRNSFNNLAVSTCGKISALVSTSAHFGMDSNIQPMEQFIQ